MFKLYIQKAYKTTKARVPCRVVLATAHLNCKGCKDGPSRRPKG